MKIDTFFKNTTECFYRVTNFNFVQNPIYIDNLTNLWPVIETYLNSGDPEKIGWAANTISLYSSIYIQNLTYHLLVCNDVLKNVYMWLNYKYL